jgi:hypothetical protein
MKRYWIEYQESPPDCPMTFWVHCEADGKPWYESAEFNPPRPDPVPGEGYPAFKVEFDGFIFEFASLVEVRVCINILGQKLMPRTSDLSRKRGAGHGPNSHWLSRLPGKVKAWRYRARAVVYLEKALVEFDKIFAER